MLIQKAVQDVIYLNYEIPVMLKEEETLSSRMQ